MLLCIYIGYNHHNFFKNLGQQGFKESNNIHLLVLIFITENRTRPAMTLQLLKPISP